jgi:DNA invertase Pin-like site-specific DNA recombinase
MLPCEVGYSYAYWSRQSVKPGTIPRSLDRQIGALNTAKADKIFREVASGQTVKGRPQLERAIDALGAGDAQSFRTKVVFSTVSLALTAKPTTQ